MLGRCIEAGLVYRGKRPVHWCWSCRTALAEAEVEYADVTSPSVYVAYAFADPLPAALAGLDDVAAAAWTTTPWTLPASLAVAVHPEHEYVAVVIGDRTLVVAAALVPRLAAAMGATETPRELRRMRGRDLEGARCRHPWLDRIVPIVLADYVTLESGTGLVHTAPGHGQDDYETGKRYGLDVLAPVDERGAFTDAVPEWQGLRVFDADPKIVEHLRCGGHAPRGRELPAQLPALLALQERHRLPRHRAVVHRHRPPAGRRPGHAARARARRDRARALDARRGDAIASTA